MRQRGRERIFNEKVSDCFTALKICWQAWDNGPKLPLKESWIWQEYSFSRTSTLLLSRSSLVQKIGQIQKANSWDHPLILLLEQDLECRTFVANAACQNTNCWASSWRVSYLVSLGVWSENLHSKMLPMLLIWCWHYVKC